LSFIAAAFNLPNFPELEEMYVTHGNWPKAPEQTLNEYMAWFHKDPCEDFSATDLPTVHRVAFLFVNNILTPKIEIKTHIQFGNLFFSRHLIGLTEWSFNIPYIIISHIQACLRYAKAALPYAHLVHHLIKHQGVDPHPISMTI
jgi:hypothetical protein